jgi:hypothetical protein
MGTESIKMALSILPVVKSFTSPRMACLNNVNMDTLPDDTVDCVILKIKNVKNKVEMPAWR